MTTLNDRSKIELLLDLLKQNQGTVTVSDLVTATGSERRARRAIFVARKLDMRLEPLRVNAGRAVTAYVRQPGGASDEEVLAGLVNRSKRERAKADKAARAAAKAEADANEQA